MGQVLRPAAPAIEGVAGEAAGGGIAPSRRVLSVDVLRGLCVAGMVLVNFPADWALRYHQLGHAEWNGPTATDMIFPMFLLLSGFSMVYSFASRSARGATRGSLARHVVVRSVILLLGLALNGFPFFRWHSLEVYGVLQRIAFCYLAGGLLVLATGKLRAGLQVNVWAVAACMVLVLAGVWAAVRFVQVPGYGAWRFDPDGNLGAVIDRAIFGNAHLSSWGGPKRMWDADGLLSCITSIPNLLLGVLAAVWMRRGESTLKTVLGMAVVAGALIGVALALSPYLVLNRKIWTDTFTLLSGGASLGVFAGFYLWLDRAGTGMERARVKWWMTPALVYGSNAILGFVLYSVLLALHGLFRLPHAHRPANWLPGTAYLALCRWIDPYNVSLLYGLVAVGVVMGVLWPLYRREVFVKL